MHRRKSRHLAEHLACLCVQHHLAETDCPPLQSTIVITCCLLACTASPCGTYCQAIRSTTVITYCMLVCAAPPCGNVLSTFTVHYCDNILFACLYSVTLRNALSSHTVHHCDNILHVCLCSATVRNTIHYRDNIFACLFVQRHPAAMYCQPLQSTIVTTFCMLVCAAPPCGNVLSTFTTRYCGSISHACVYNVTLRKCIVKPYSPLL